ncbi:MAG: pilus assembly protein [Parasphingopyxis sp.]|uniref:TadE/TadG family type IV pilus assembly protein n=1 Tax=Parasphingopyxis sp. TaxID=1920299 RepID=UPI0032EC5A6B
MKFLRTIFNRGKNAELTRNERGLALTEFAMALPLVLALLFGALETANYALAHLRVSQIAMTVADNAGRSQTTVDEADVHEAFTAADLIGQPIDFEEHGRIVLSSLEPNGRSGGEEGQMINWQRCMGELDVGPAYGVQDDGRTNSSLADGLGPNGNKITSPDETAVMFVEATYDYQPLIGFRIIGQRTIRYESAFIVRDRDNNNITNTQSLNRYDDCSGEPYQNDDGCGDANNGHGNDEDGTDDCNPGQGGGGPNGSSGGSSSDGSTSSSSSSGGSTTRSSTGGSTSRSSSGG